MLISAPTSSKWHFPSDLPGIILTIHRLWHECFILLLSRRLTCNDHNSLSRTVRHFACVMTHKTTSTLQTFQISKLMHNSYIFQQYICYTTLLNMFRAARCSSSGGPLVSPQPLVSSPSVSSRTVCRWRADCTKRSEKCVPGNYRRLMLLGAFFQSL